MDKQIETNFRELYKFSQELNRFADELEYQIRKLVNETNSVTGYSWQGRQADEFSGLINDTEKDLQKEIATLRELSAAIYEKARELEAIDAIRFS